MDFEVLYSLLNALKEKSLLHLKKDNYINTISNDHINASIATNIFITNLEYIVENNPEKIIHYFRSFLSKNQSLTRILTKLDIFINVRDNPSPAIKMEMIALFWEASELFSFCAFIMSKGKEDYSSLRNASEIFKYFKSVGLSSNDKEMINGIRNSNNHVFTISNLSIIDDKGRRVCSISDLDSIFNKISDIIGWYGAMLVVSIYYYPKFFLIAMFSILTEYNTNKDMYVEWYESLKIMSPNLFKEEDKMEKLGELQSESKLSEDNQKTLELIGTETITKFNDHIIIENDYSPINMKVIKYTEFQVYFNQFKKRLYEFIRLVDSIKMKSNDENYNEMVTRFQNDINNFYDKIKLIKKNQLILIYNYLKSIKFNK